MKKFFLNLFFNLFVGAVLFSVFGGSPALGACVGGVAGFLVPSVTGGLTVGVFREVWTGETIKAFRNSLESIGWLQRLPDKSQYAENDAIHFTDLGGDPDVLVNNTSYPIEVQELEDGDKVVKLDKYQTKATPITDDELYACSYDKMGSVIERHREKVDETKIARALHSLAPAKETAFTPVLLTSGETDATEGRKRITKKDIIRLKKAFDKQKVPSADRILVLCPDHVNDLLETDQKFAQQYYNYTTGKIANLYGFEVYEYTDAPVYSDSKVKKAFGAALVATDRQASVAFYAKNNIRATGSTTTYLSEAKNNPTTQRNLFNLRHYFMALPLKERAMGVIVSSNVSAKEETPEPAPTEA